jgi:hypothetical protein
VGVGGTLSEADGAVALVAAVVVGRGDAIPCCSLGLLLRRSSEEEQGRRASDGGRCCRCADAAHGAARHCRCIIIILLVLLYADGTRAPAREILTRTT